MNDYLQIPYNRTLGKSLKILELLSDQGALNDQQIAEKLNYNLLTVQQLLVVYKDYGYVACDEKGLYDLSVKNNSLTSNKFGKQTTEKVIKGFDGAIFSARRYRFIDADEHEAK